MLSAKNSENVQKKKYGSHCTVSNNYTHQWPLTNWRWKPEQVYCMFELDINLADQFEHTSECLFPGKSFFLGVLWKLSTPASKYFVCKKFEITGGQKHVSLFTPIIRLIAHHYQSDFIQFYLSWGKKWVGGRGSMKTSQGSYVILILDWTYFESGYKLWVVHEFEASYLRVCLIWGMYYLYMSKCL